MDDGARDPTVGLLKIGIAAGDTLTIGSDIVLTFIKKKGRYAVFAIKCPKSIKILRQRVTERGDLARVVPGEDPKRLIEPG